jgi:O-antigen/teichoic acid export membrane protein
MTLGAIGLGLPVLFLGPWLFPALFGTEFAGSVAVFGLLWIGLVAAGTLGLTLALANMTGQHLLATKAFAVIAVTNLLCGLVLIPAHGALGGAVGTVIGTLLGTGWCAFTYQRRTGLNPTLFQAGAIGIGRDALRIALVRLRGSDRA